MDTSGVNIEKNKIRNIVWLSTNVLDEINIKTISKIRHYHDPKNYPRSMARQKRDAS